MNITKTIGMLGLAAALPVANANAAHVIKTGDISTSETWTADNVYQLDGTVAVLEGATLTIEAGTVIKSDFADGTTDPAAPLVDSVLLINRGAQVFIQGTEDNPVVFTSTSDGPPTSSTLGGERDANNEWGSIGIQGRARIGGLSGAKDGTPLTFEDGVDNVITNTGKPDFANLNELEGIENTDSDSDGIDDDPRALYGGLDDDDDSGSISYLSIRYGGRFGGVSNSELNGISLGGVGRGTDVCGIDIWNNIDDGIEIFGGTVNFKKVSIWNIGDDSFDVDEGWRGKAQFGLIVQGASGTGSQGSGVGDNCFEHDGGQPSWVQPLTTSTIYNFTVVGNPDDGDYATAWRDGARLQYRNCIFMDIGDDVIHEQNSENTTTNTWRYGENLLFAGPGGTGSVPTFSEIFDYAYTEVHNTANGDTGGHPFAAGFTQSQLEALYPAQSAGDSAIMQGYMAEMTNCVYYNIADTGLASSVGPGSETILTSTTVGNATLGNVVASTLPIKDIVRQGDPGQPAKRVQSTKTIPMVITIDPRPSTDPAATDGDADSTIYTAPADGFFAPAPYIGGFSPLNNWATGWTAAGQYGKFTGAANPSDPDATIELATTVVSFDTVNGGHYLIESSTDGTTWVPEAVVEGDGGSKSVAGELGVGFSSSKLYRVSAL